MPCRRRLPRRLNWVQCQSRSRRRLPLAPAPPAPEEGLHTVKSPIVGTFYEAPSPGAPPFVKAGDTVEVGQVLCIVEAMKLLNEIESDVAGEIVKKLAVNGQPIEYGQELFVDKAEEVKTGLCLGARRAAPFCLPANLA